MKLSSNADGEMPRRYVQQLSLQSRISRDVYRCILNNFWRLRLNTLHVIRSMFLLQPQNRILPRPSLRQVADGLFTDGPGSFSARDVPLMTASPV